MTYLAESYAEKRSLFLQDDLISRDFIPEIIKSEIVPFSPSLFPMLEGDILKPSTLKGVLLVGPSYWTDLPKVKQISSLKTENGCQQKAVKI